MLFPKTEGGFTFIEVLVAMAIFVLAAVVAVRVGQGAVFAIAQAKRLTEATWLVQKAMVELQTKVETAGFDKGCVPKTEGGFPPPHQQFTWIAYCNPVDLQISQSVADAALKQKQGAFSQAGGAQGGGLGSNQSLAEKMVLETANKYFSQAIRELHVEVDWVQGKDKRHITLTTHVARMDQPLVLPSLTFGGVSQ